MKHALYEENKRKLTMFIHLSFLLALVILITMFSIIVACFATTLLPEVTSRQPKLIWEENFDSLNENIWHHLVTAWGGGNNEFIYYRNDRRNSWVDKGTLKIKPTPTSDELSDDEIRHGRIYDPECNMEPCISQSGPDSVKPVFSARLYTQGSFDVTYGKVQIRAKIPRGDWIWPAIWMLPTDDAYGSSPRSGEIDIFENRGNRNLRDSEGNSVGIDVFASTLHWGPSDEENGFPATSWEKRIKSGDYSDNFHVYEVERTTTNITFRIDGALIGSVTPPAGGFWELGHFKGDNIWAKGGHMAPFDKPFYIILNVAVGGNYFDDNFINQPYPRPWDSKSDHPMLQFYEAQQSWLPTWDRPQMEVDWIRVYETATEVRKKESCLFGLFC